MYGGINRNHFTINRYIAPTPVNRNPHSLEARNGFAIGLAVADIKVVNHWKPRLALQFEQYTGGFDLNSGGQGQQYYAHGEITLSVLRMSFYPLNFNLWKVLRTSVGMQLGMRLHERAKGHRGGGGAVEVFWEDLSEATRGDWGWYGGVVTQIALEIKCHENWWIVPQYTAYFGLGNELSAYRYERSIRAFRQLGAIGIRKRFDWSRDQKETSKV